MYISINSGIIFLFQKKIVILRALFKSIYFISNMAKDTTNNSGSTHNALTHGSIITGNISSENDFRIDGEVKGDMHCKGKVVIGHTGMLRGKITCVNAEIIGSVLGNIIVSDTLTLRSTANVTGDIKTRILVVEPSAVLNGNCSMKEEQLAE